jgi:hypothetical protein
VISSDHHSLVSLASAGFSNRLPDLFSAP